MCQQVRPVKKLNVCLVCLPCLLHCSPIAVCAKGWYSFNGQVPQDGSCTACPRNKTTSSIGTQANDESMCGKHSASRQCVGGIHCSMVQTVVLRALSFGPWVVSLVRGIPWSAGGPPGQNIPGPTHMHACLCLCVPAVCAAGFAGDGSGGCRACGVGFWSSDDNMCKECPAGAQPFLLPSLPAGRTAVQPCTCQISDTMCHTSAACPCCCIWHEHKMH